MYYTSCFTDEYQDVCQQQKTEDIRFSKGIYHLLQHEDVVYEMLKIYFEAVFKYKTFDQLEHIKKTLMAVNVHIAANSLTSHGFALATAMSVAVSLNLSLSMSALVGRAANTVAVLDCIAWSRRRRIALRNFILLILFTILPYTLKSWK